MTPTPIPVLLYHGVDTTALPDFQPWVMHPDRFAAHLDLIVERGHTAMTVSALVDAIRHGRTLPERPVAITFDDGLADFAEHAWPALRQRDLTATLYVVTDGIGERAAWLADGEEAPRMLTWDQVRTLDIEGCEIGSHSLSHPELDTLRGATLADEVALSRRELSTRLGHPVRSFAYPHGYHDRRVRQAVIDAGYDSACAVREALSSRGDDTFALARVTLLHDATTDDLAAVLDGRDHRVAPFPEAVRTKAWRVVRRVGGRQAVTGAVSAVERLRRGRAA